MLKFVSNIYTAGGKKVIQCNIRDISATVKAQGDLLKSEENYRKLVDNAWWACTNQIWRENTCM